MRRRVEVGPTWVCSDEYGVTELRTEGGGPHVHRRQPCEQCPWRMDVPTGVFPPDAFRESAPTAYDMATKTFACHMSGTKGAATCAGFLMRHAVHNLSVRLAQIKGRLDLGTVIDGGYPLYETYREMAVANGVPEDDPVLLPVRGREE